MRIACITLLWFSLTALSAFAAGSSATSHRLFGGGMAVQAGYVKIDNEFGTINGVMRGLGGRLHFYLGKHLRAGGAGAAVSLAYDKPGVSGSYVRVGYGGLTAEATGQRGRWRYSAGLLVGGASFENMHIVERTDRGRFDGYLDDRATFMISPLFTLERSMTDAISLMVMADYLWGPELGVRRHFGGPKVHLGVLFNK